MYEVHVRKYSERPHLLEERIPVLGNCLWNDVLFLSAVHPQQLRDASEKVGFRLPESFRSFEIDPHLLDPDKTAVWLFRERFQSKYIVPGNYARFDPDDIASYADIGERTLNYYREEVAAGRNPFLFIYVPHILYKGTLDVSAMRIVEA